MEPVLYSDSIVRLLGDDCLHSLKCSICLEFFDNPIVLNCGHTFCLTCIQNTTNYVLSQNPHLPPWKVFVYCPECRRPFNANKLSKKGITVPSNYSVVSLLDTLKSVTIPLKIDACTTTEDLSTQADAETQTCDLQDDKEQEVLELNKKQIDELEQRVNELSLLSKSSFKQMRKDKRLSTCPCPNKFADQPSYDQHISKNNIKIRKMVKSQEKTGVPRASISNVHISNIDAKIKDLAKFIDDSEIIYRNKQCSRLN